MASFRVKESQKKKPHRQPSILSLGLVNIHVFKSIRQSFMIITYLGTPWWLWMRRATSSRRIGACVCVCVYLRDRTWTTDRTIRSKEVASTFSSNWIQIEVEWNASSTHGNVKSWCSTRLVQRALEAPHLRKSKAQPAQHEGKHANYL